LLPRRGRIGFHPVRRVLLKRRESTKPAESRILSYSDSHAYSDTYPNTDEHSDSHEYADTYADSDTNPHTDMDEYSNAHRDSDVGACAAAAAV
jgi:hypothetical protein